MKADTWSPAELDRLRSRIAKLRRLSEDPRAPLEERRRAYEKWTSLVERLPKGKPQPKPQARPRPTPMPDWEEADVYRSMSASLRAIVTFSLACEVILAMAGSRRARRDLF